jgi:transaldolase
MKLNVKLFADGADIAGIREMASNSSIAGFTTNPTLMRKAGVSDYKAFAKEVLTIVPDKPVSFEVFADDFPTMERQALEIASWGKNVNIKIPVTNTKGEFCGALVKRLSDAGVQLNVTALMTLDQVQRVIWASPRELLNIFQAEEVGCHIITATNDILKKLSLFHKDLNLYSLETVEMFYKDAKAAGFNIAV